MKFPRRDQSLNQTCKLTQAHSFPPSVTLYRGVGWTRSRKATLFRIRSWLCEYNKLLVRYNQAQISPATRYWIKRGLNLLPSQSFRHCLSHISSYLVAKSPAINAQLETNPKAPTRFGCVQNKFREPVFQHLWSHPPWALRKTKSKLQNSNKQ